MPRTKVAITLNSELLEELERGRDVQIEAISADESLARHLRIAEASPLLRIERLTHAGERPIDFEFLYYRGDAFQYRLRIDRC